MCFSQLFSVSYVELHSTAILLIIIYLSYNNLQRNKPRLLSIRRVKLNKLGRGLTIINATDFFNSCPIEIFLHTQVSKLIIMEEAVICSLLSLLISVNQ